MLSFSKGYLMKVLNAVSIMVVGVVFSQAALAGAIEYTDVKLPCAVLKNGKVLKQRTCIAQGFEHGNGHGGGYGWIFEMQGYGIVKLDGGTIFKTDTTKEKSWITLNGKNAKIRMRMPRTFAIFSQAQERQYQKRGIEITPYTCWYYTKKTNTKFDEVCYLHRE